MGPLKDGLYLAVWSHLQSMPKCQTLLTALNHPISGSQAIRNAWSELKKDGRNEGIKKQTGLQSVLSERPDIFVFETTDRGHQLIGLSEGAQALDLLESIPAHVASPATAAVSAQGAGGLASLAAVLERPAKVQRIAKGKGKGAPVNSPNSCAYGGSWNGWCFTDIVWTPELQQKKNEERQKEMKLVRALYRAMDMHAGKCVTLSQLGSDFKVAELKKDPHFKNWRLLDILKEYENVFELVPASGGMTVKLQPGAEAALPDAELAAEQVNEAELMLPERIDNPKGTKERIQALRIELLYALQRRGGRTAIQELGQEPRVQKVKQDLRQQRKLVDWIRIFPENFKILPEKTDGQMVVEIVSMDVHDQSMIEKAIAKNEQESNKGASSKSRVSSTTGRPNRTISHHGSHHSMPSSPAYPPVPGYPGYGGYGGAALGYGLPSAFPQSQPQAGYGYPAYPPTAPHPAGYPPPVGYPTAGYTPAGAGTGYPPAGYAPVSSTPTSFPQMSPPPAGYGAPLQGCAGLHWSRPEIGYTYRVS